MNHLHKCLHVICSYWITHGILFFNDIIDKAGIISQKVVLGKLIIE